MENIRIVFMGTPTFACGVLNSLINSKYQVVGVVSQPDKKVGRKQILTFTPVKELALKNNVEVFQPIKIKDDYDQVKAWNPDLIVTCAYGQMLSDEILNFPKYGSLNVHASLLPKYRGGAPIHQAIIDGNSESGVSIMRMVQKMDAGDYMLQEKVDINEDDTTGTLHDKLMDCGAKLIIKAIDLLINNQAVFIKQNEAEASYAFNIKKEDEVIDFSKTNKEVYNQIRGLTPWPVANFTLKDCKIKIHLVKLTDLKPQGASGSLFCEGKHLYLNTKDGVIEILLIQKAGKKRMDATSFISGNRELLNG